MIVDTVSRMYFFMQNPVAHFRPADLRNFAHAADGRSQLNNRLFSGGCTLVYAVEVTMYKAHDELYRRMTRSSDPVVISWGKLVIAIKVLLCGETWKNE